MSKYQHYEKLLHNLKMGFCYAKTIDSAYRSDYYLNKAETDNNPETQLANIVYATIYNLISASNTECYQQYINDTKSADIALALEEYEHNLHTSTPSYQQQRFQALVNKFDNPVYNEELIMHLLRNFSDEHVMILPDSDIFSHLPDAQMGGAIQPLGAVLEA